jgi:ABC-type transport system involved in cytochrome bd biosynthesis fused ATPase/permease subunit
MTALEQLMRGRTTFMIAHRVGTLAICELRLEMEGGRLVNAGRPPVPDARAVLSGTAASISQERTTDG